MRKFFTEEERRKAKSLSAKKSIEKRKAEETPEEREIRMEKVRAWHRNKKANETPEEKEIRLVKRRAYLKKRYRENPEIRLKDNKRRRIYRNRKKVDELSKTILEGDIYEYAD